MLPLARNTTSRRKISCAADDIVTESHGEKLGLENVRKIIAESLTTRDGILYSHSAKLLIIMMCQPNYGSHNFTSFRAINFSFE